MNQTLLDLLSLQGEIKVRLMRAGLSQDISHETAADLLDYIARSPVVTEDHRKDYLELPSWTPNPA